MQRVWFDFAREHLTLFDVFWQWCLVFPAQELDVDLRLAAAQLLKSEIAIALERAVDLYNDQQFLNVLNKGLENLTITNIIEDDSTYTQMSFT